MSERSLIITVRKSKIGKTMYISSQNTPKLNVEELMPILTSEKGGVLITEYKKPKTHIHTRARTHTRDTMF